MRVGILGGTRFIGFHVVEALLKDGAEVWIFHRGQSREPRSFSGPVERVLGDRDQALSLAPFFQRTYDAVIDLSGYTPRHLEPILSQWRSRIGHYLFCSTSSVYQIPPPLFFDESAPVAKRAGTYGGDKVLAEEALLDQCAERDWPATVFRPQGVLGPFGAEQPLYAARRIAAGQPLLLRPETVGRRINLLGVDDLVRCFLAAIGNPAAFGQVFNVAGSDVHTPESFGLLIRDITGRGQARQFVLDGGLCGQLPQLGLSWLPYDLIANNQKIKDRLGVSFTPLREVLERIWRWSQVGGRLRLKRQRWERQALEGKAPSRWIKLFWRSCDVLRAGLTLCRKALYNVQILNIWRGSRKAKSA